MPKSNKENYKNVKLDGKTVVITGANTGIGKETAKDLALRGAIVVMGCRDLEKADKAINDIISCDGLSAESFFSYELDLSSLDSVRKFAAEILEYHKKIHILINNAGIMTCPEWKTKENFEMQIGVNHFGHFLLTNLLLDRLKESAPSRIVVVSSMAHEHGKIHFDGINLEKKYSPIKAYAQSKLANVLFAKELAERLKDTEVTAYSLHPGVINTELSRHVGDSINRFIGWFYRKFSPYLLSTPTQGAQTTIYCAVAEGLEIHSGKYFSNCALKTPSREAQKMEDAKRLWELSEEMVNLKKN